MTTSTPVSLRRGRQSWWYALPLALLVVIAGIITVVRLIGPDTFEPDFGDSGLITNELTERHAEEPGVRRDDDWVATSGSLFAVDGMGYSGKPDDTRPDPASAQTTDSAVLRVITRRRDFADEKIRLKLHLVAFSATERTPAQDYDGVHLLVRYKSAQELYAVSLQRRDGKVAIKRKDPGGPSNGGSYTLLAETVFPWTQDWVDVSVTVRDAPDNTTRISLKLNGKQILSTTDASERRVSGAGGFGLRGDNSEFYFKDVLATELE